MTTALYRLIDSDEEKWLVEADDADEAKGFVVDGAQSLDPRDPYSIVSCRRLPGGARLGSYDDEMSGFVYRDGLVGIVASSQLY